MVPSPLCITLLLEERLNLQGAHPPENFQSVSNESQQEVFNQHS